LFEFSTYVLEVGESIAWYVVTTATGLAKDSDALVDGGENVQVSVSGGTAGKGYWVRCTVTTTAGRTYSETLDVEVV
jgi:hypothetical protein